MNQQPDTVAPYPYALGPEKAVLSVLLQYPEKLDDAPTLTAEHFYIPAHREVFSLLQELSVSGRPIELVSFTQLLLDRGKLEMIGGPSALTDIHNYQAAPSQFQTHIDFLTDKLARRMTITAAAEMNRVAYEAAEAQEIIEVTSAPISAIHDTLTSTRPARSTKAVLRGCIDRFEQLCNGRTSPMGIETSLIEINRRFRGLHPKQTIVISGYPGGGKTTLAGQLAIDAAIDGHNTLVCSLEMPEEAFMDRLLAYVAHRPADAITDPLRYARDVFQLETLPKHTLQAIATAAQKIAACPLAIDDLIGSNVHQIASCIRRAHRKSPLKVAVVDFVQRIRPVPEMRRESREQQLAHASNHLADLSKELGFCLLIPSQLNKEGAAKHAEAINEDADLHLQIVQDRSGANPTFKHIGIAVVKDRHHGQDGTLLPIVLDGPNVRFIPKPFEK
ncbi:MAG: replicative DNA helicase [Verrucomicrobia bacterium]|nr:replicative DNA helicase [Verrucomicrobiota bacterium]